MIARIRLLVVVLVGLTAAPAAGIAQAAAPEIGSAAPAGPRRDVTATALRQAPQQQAATLDVTQRRSRQPVGRPVALMIVGGAALVIGALIGNDVGTIFMIGGAVTFLIGLFQYLE